MLFARSISWSTVQPCSGSREPVRLLFARERSRSAVQLSSGARLPLSWLSYDGSCAYDIYGCSDADALNFDSTATVSAGCVARIEGCTVSSAKNFAADANVAANDECIYA